MEAVKTHYDTLGVPKDADKTTIKSAYRRLARMYHPDYHPGDKAAESSFKTIVGAYEIIGNPEKKAAYDQSLRTTTSQVDFQAAFRAAYQKRSYQAILEKLDSLVVSHGLYRDKLNKTAKTAKDIHNAYLGESADKWAFKPQHTGLTGIFRNVADYILTSAKRRALRESEEENLRETLPARERAMEFIDFMGSVHRRMQDSHLGQEIYNERIIVMELIERKMPIPVTSTLKILDDIQKKIDLRHQALDSAIDVLSGRAKTMRYELKK